MCIRDSNLGIDFEGGTQLTFPTTQPTQLGTVSNIVVKTTGQRSASVVGTGKTVGGSESYKGFQIRLRSLTSKVETNLTSELKAKAHVTAVSGQTVSASSVSYTHL